MNFIIEKITRVFWSALGYVIPKKSKYIVLSTYPDFDDTFRALQQAVRSSDNKLIVLTSRVHIPPLGACDRGTVVAAAKSIRGIWYYHRAQTILFTHGLFSRWPPHRTQLVINLWHGSPIKNICLLDNKSPKEIPQSSYVLAESIAYKTIIADAFGVSSRHVIVHKHPRIDMLYSSKVSAIRQLNPEKIIIAWLPTYRKTFTGDPRDDGNAHKDVLSSSFDAKCLDLVLDKYNAICVVKPHPMAIFPEQLFSEAERIFMLDNADLAAENLSVYEFLSNTDLLITDLSSVYFDYRLTGKPSLLFFPDRAEYSVNRGFVRPLEDIVSDGFVEEFGEFIQVLDAMLEQMKVRNPTANQLPHPAAAKFSSEFLALIDTLKTGMGAD